MMEGWMHDGCMMDGWMDAEYEALKEKCLHPHTLQPLLRWRLHLLDCRRGDGSTPPRQHLPSPTAGTRNSD